MYKTTLSLLIAGILVFSCDGIEDSLVNDRLEENPLPTVEANSGNADFSNYVAVGNSLTAGFMDGALYTSGQAKSIAALLGQQLQTVGTTTVNQPHINSENGFNAIFSNLEANIIAGKTELNVDIPGPVPTEGEWPIPAFTGDKASINNFGVPGIRLADLFSTDVQPNTPLGLYYSRFASSPGTSTIMSDVVASNPTFFSLWIGNNDVLQYALSGGISETLITPTADFQTDFGKALGALVGTGAKGVVVNIPPIVVIPFFQGHYLGWYSAR